jgi:hypothetical protein
MSFTAPNESGSETVEEVGERFFPASSKSAGPEKPPL